MKSKILVVDEDKEIDIPVSELSQSDVYDVKTIASGDQAIQLLANDNFDVLIISKETETTEDAHKKALFDVVVEAFPALHCIVLSRNASIKESIDVLKNGGFDYIPAPVSAKDLIASVLKAIENKKGIVANDTVPVVEPPSYDTGIVGESPEIRKVLRNIEKVAMTDSSVLITGESGTGKELIARAIHQFSGRRNGPLVIINCGAIPGELLESELFGHEKGAFTGANRTRIGRFELAHRGTIFLDEIGDMSPDLQVKLLRALQEQSFERVGGMRSIQVDIRIISATNKDLMAAINASSFREDLYYRLNVIPIQVPPLRNRKSDIPLLIRHFLSQIAKRMAQKEKWVNQEAMKLLDAYGWPGNIRELENMMERLSVLVDDDEIDVPDLPEHIQRTEIKSSSYLLDIFESGIGFNEAVETHQKALILKALEKTGGVKAKAAELLKMNRTTLVEKIKKLKLETENEPPLNDDFINFPE